MWVSLGVINLTVSPVIRRDQVVTVSYTDPTSGNDDKAIQDSAGNDAASFENVVVRNRSTDTTGLPGAPTGLTATKMGATQIDLSWTAPTDIGDADITGYRIEWSDAGATGPWTDLIADTGNTDTTYSDTGLASPTRRHYRVSARNSFGYGPASNVDFATTDDIVPPVLVAALVPDVGTLIYLTFDEALDQTSGNAPAKGAFTVTADGAPVAIGSVGLLSLLPVRVQLGGFSRTIKQGQTVTVTYTDPTTGNDAAAIQDEVGNDAATFTTGKAGVPAVVNSSNVANPAPDAPTGLTATKMGSAQIDLSWTEPADPGDAVITGYRIEVSDAGATGPWTELITDTGNTDTTYSDTGLTPETTRHYRVRAINSFGPGPASNVDFATTDDIVPPVLVAALVPDVGTLIYLTFDEALDQTSGNAPAKGAFTVTADGAPVAIGSVGLLSLLPVRVQLGGFSRTIKQGQTVTVTYTDPTTGNDAAAIQDEVGNDAATFTTGVSGVPAVVNNSNQPGVKISKTALNIDEGGTGTYTVALYSQPTATVTVTPSRSSGDCGHHRRGRPPHLHHDDLECGADGDGTRGRGCGFGSRYGHDRPRGERRQLRLGHGRFGDRHRG